MTGAETSVSLRGSPAFNRSIKRGRETSSGQEGVNATASTRGGELCAHAGRLTLVTEERGEGKPSPAAGKLITRSSKGLISPSV
jgi:hypothetical protein